MDQAALDRLIASIDTLESLFEQAQGDPLSPLWAQMLRELEVVREQVDRLNPH